MPQNIAALICSFYMHSSCKQCILHPNTSQQANSLLKITSPNLLLLLLAKNSAVTKRFYLLLRSFFLYQDRGCHIILNKIKKNVRSPEKKVNTSTIALKENFLATLAILGTLEPANGGNCTRWTLRLETDATDSNDTRRVRDWTTLFQDSAPHPPGGGANE